MADITSIFGGSFTPPEKKHQYAEPPEKQLIDTIANYGYEPPETIKFDGKIHRFSTTGKKRDDSGWYVAFDGKVHAGAFGCWKDGSAVNWREDLGRELSMAEEMEHQNRMKKLRAIRAEEEKRRQGMTADTVSSIWANAVEADNNHPYLQSKKVSSHGLKVTGDGRLMVPMFNESGELASLQYIDSAGDKKYHPGGKTKGAFYVINGEGDDVFLAEGYATAATIHEQTGATVYVGFSASQLSPVAEIIKSHHDSTLTIIADNDHSGTGQKEARKAADLTKSRVVMPPDVGTDANDYYQSGGDIASLIYPPTDDWLISADEFSQEPAPIRWLIKNYLQREALIMVHGPSGGGKTFAVLDMCCHISSNKDEWCENKVHHGGVVYLAGEGHQGLRGRLAAWKQFNQVESLNMWLSKAGTDLNTPEGYDKVSRSISSLPEPPALIVVDTLHRFLQGDENSAQDAKTMLDACNALMREFECSVLLVHHTGVSEDAQHRARGSSAWRGALEIELSVSPKTDTEPMQIIPRKSKDSELGNVISGRLESVQLPWIDEDGEAVTSAVFDYEGSSTITAKEAESHFNARQVFENAFIQYGEIVSDECVLSESAWRDFYRNMNAEKKPETIKKSFQRAKKTMEDSGTIAKKGHSYIVKNEVMAAALKVLKNVGGHS